MTAFALAHPWLFTLIALAALFVADSVLVAWATAFVRRGRS